jgi:RimJ/RimL family protein N-acetyltransferase
MSTPVLETPRLVMRPPTEADFEGWAAFCADPVSMTFLGGPLARGAAWRNMLTFAGAWTIQGFGYFSVIEKASGAWVGRVGPWLPADWPGTEIGWGLLRAHTGKGYAVEAATAAMNFAFDTLGWERVVHIIDPNNVGSHAVARRLGSQNFGKVDLAAPHQDWPVELWGQSRDEWRAAVRR